MARGWKVPRDGGVRLAHASVGAAGVRLAWSAAVGGGVPVLESIRALRREGEIVRVELETAPVGAGIRFTAIAATDRAEIARWRRGRGAA